MKKEITVISGHFLSVCILLYFSSPMPLPTYFSYVGMFFVSDCWMGVMFWLADSKPYYKDEAVKR